MAKNQESEGTAADALFVRRFKELGGIGLFTPRVRSVKNTKTKTDDGVVETITVEFGNKASKDEPAPVQLRLKNVPDGMFTPGTKLLVLFKDDQKKLDAFAEKNTPREK